MSIIRAPHYEGIGPVDESGIPIAIRTVSSHTHKRVNSEKGNLPAARMGCVALHGRVRGADM